MDLYPNQLFISLLLAGKYVLFITTKQHVKILTSLGLIAFSFQYIITLKSVDIGDHKILKIS